LLPGVATGPPATLNLPAPATDAAAAATATGRTLAAAEPPLLRVGQTAAGQRFDTRDLYPVLAGIAVLAGAGVFLVGLFGVRMR